MKREEHTDVVVATGNERTRRISWGAIIAGVVMALVVQLLLSLLGIGIGASSIDPLSETNPTAGVATGAGIWFAVSLLIALFVGGLVAGRAAGIFRRTDGLLHGLVAWGLTVLLMFYLLSTTVGGLIGGTARILGNTLSATGAGIAAAAPAASEQLGNAANAVQDQLPEGSTVDWQALEEQALALLADAGVNTAPISDAITETITTTQQLSETVSAIGDDPQAREELMALVQRIATNSGDSFSQADRQELVNFIVENGGQNEQQAQEMVNNLEETYQEIRTQAQETAQQAQAAGQEALQQAEQTTREAGQVVADNVSSAALWTLIGLLFSALAAAIGGYIAVPRRVVA